MSKLRPDHHQQQGVSAVAFAKMTGLPVQAVLRYCKTGRIIGARKHPLTKRWWIYPPAKLVTGRLL